jgi:peroxiredoxin
MVSALATANAFSCINFNLSRNFKARTAHIASCYSKNELERKYRRRKIWLTFLPLAGPSCSESHIPGYINYENLKDAGDVFVVSVNDAFV